MPSSIFTLFETVAIELSSVPARVITERDWERADTNNPFVEELMGHYGTSFDDAIVHAVADLQVHFTDRQNRLPFTYDPRTGEFSSVDPEYISFINQVYEIRSEGVSSASFEKAVLGRIALRVMGSLHRVGHPRELHRTNVTINSYLHGLGFAEKTLRGRQKDGGLDIIWSIPFGAVPYRPLAVVQCKNGSLSWKDADASVATCTRTIFRHRGLMPEAHIQCVVFNDYVLPESLPDETMQYVPLGLSDLATPTFVGCSQSFV
jgi:hypothetical protein